jgi:hypothetical protein
VLDRAFLACVESTPRTRSMVPFVAPAACLIESDCCEQGCRESAWAEPSRFRMGWDAGSLLRRIGCGSIAISVNSMLSGRCWDARERAFSPRTMRSTEGLDRRALATFPFPSSPSVIAGVRGTSGVPIESDRCGWECRESAWAEPSRSRMGWDAGSLLRRIGCGWIAVSVDSMLAGRCWDARERAFSPRTMRSTEGLDRRALATFPFPSSPSVIAGVIWP